MHVIKFSVLQNHSALPLAIRAVALLFRLQRVALTSRIICSRIALRRCPARSGSLYPPLAALTSGAPKSKEKSRRLPIFPGRLQPSIFGTTKLNYCVRNGNRWILGVIGTGYGCCHPLFYCRRFAPSKLNKLNCFLVNVEPEPKMWSSPRPISTR